ncbi:DUF1203 domain-containing protein [Streptosporangiaceae bacterium NEAU-GS5]|nr:DUF1203 domain-containing protein [Streptosporangiaceae bacterium NEAU-GS5]
MEFEIRAIDPTVVKELLDTDDAGREPRFMIDESGGSPLRCCLAKAAPGERIALLSYAPLRRWAAETGADPGPYDEQGPIFVHAGTCPGPQTSGWPAAHAGSSRVLRAYGTAGAILGGTLLPAGHDPAEATQAIHTMLADPQVALIHVRALEYGCFQFEIRPAEPRA